MVKRYFSHYLVYLLPARGVWIIWDYSVFEFGDAALSDADIGYLRLRTSGLQYKISRSRTVRGRRGVRGCNL
jgi:hypothetical protein